MLQKKRRFFAEEGGACCVAEISEPARQPERYDQTTP